MEVPVDCLIEFLTKHKTTYKGVTVAGLLTQDRVAMTQTEMEECIRRKIGEVCFTLGISASHHFLD